MPVKVKATGENPNDPVAPALANAIEDAARVRIRDLPIAQQSEQQSESRASKGSMKIGPES